MDMPDIASIRKRFPLQARNVEIRHFSEDHINDQYLSWLNDAEVLRYSNQRFKSHGYESCRAYLKSFQDTENIFMAIHVKQSGLFVGTMTAYFSTPHKTVDLGIMIGDKEFWGKGIGRDAWESVMSLLLDTNHVRKVTGGALRCNVSMVNIMMKAEMQPDGVRVAHELVGNIPHDILYFARFKSV
jgi:ribosomal-protein-alanine N-acetyltransferase